MHQSTDPTQPTQPSQLPEGSSASVDEQQITETPSFTEEVPSATEATEAPLTEKEELSQEEEAPTADKVETVDDPQEEQVSEAEIDEEYEDEEVDDEEPESLKKYWVICGVLAALLVVACIGIAAFVTHGFRPEPANGWITTTTNNNPSHPKIAIFIHWKNDNGKLKGELENGIKDEGISYSFNGTYDYESHKVKLFLSVNGQPLTLNGTIKDNTLTINDDSGTSGLQNLKLHSGSEDDYENTKSQYA
ncbi:hypothetical protein [Tengunoibacter tsumagoiensis]|uniref:Uncharacterized protein n=1 Tax=Tengunoibacter tsumagoiensis TaxID=2014871 RepID=A0A401ZUC7_9CHLR|nr:hypothetical protein [Tengunoibacter tsumagoiensis]GCE10463.1 hypothetical protein KTT_03220 [Tengunoibacter tsumagoiensis]